MKAISPVIRTKQKSVSHAKPARRPEGEPELVSLYAEEGAFPQPGEAGDSFHGWRKETVRCWEAFSEDRTKERPCGSSAL